MSAIQLFDVHGDNWRFGVDPNGRPYVVAADISKRLDYASTQKALQLVDDDEKGLTGVVTPGGEQQMWVLYEDGIWELIFRSGKAEAKAIKKRVKAILREIQQTGRFEVEPLDELQLAERNVQLIKDKRAAIARAVQAEERLAIAAPKADAWEVLASAAGDYSVREAAHILNRDPNINTGQNRLFDVMKELKLIDRWKRPYQTHSRHVRLRTMNFRKPGADVDSSDKQTRVTVEGLRYLHNKLGGTAPVSSLLGPSDATLPPRAIPSQASEPEALFELEAHA